jgi:hypothetical protein
VTTIVIPLAGIVCICLEPKVGLILPEVTRGGCGKVGADDQDIFVGVFIQQASTGLNA